jgi:hypothetical protein
MTETQRQMIDYIIIHLLVIETGIVWPDDVHIKECADLLRRCTKDNQTGNDAQWLTEIGCKETN